MGWKTITARAMTFGAALLVLGAGTARAKDPSEILQQDLIVTRVQRGKFPSVRLWIMPISAESMQVDDVEPHVYEVVPNFLKGKDGTITNLTHPRNVRNIGAYYLEPGDKVFCAKATYLPQSNRWVLDSIQRITERRGPKLVRGRKKVAEDPLEVEIATDKKQYAPGEAIRVTLKAKNRADKPLELLFPTGETHAMVVYAGVDEVWRLQTILQTTPDPKKVTLKPGETLTFTEVWDQKTIEGKPAEPGRYFVGGKVISEGRAVLPESRFLFRIKAAEGQQASADPPAQAN